MQNAYNPKPNHHNFDFLYYLSGWINTALGRTSNCAPISLRYVIYCRSHFAREYPDIVMSFCAAKPSRLSWAVCSRFQRNTAHVCWLLVHFSLTFCLFDRLWYVTVLYGMDLLSRSYFLSCLLYSTTHVNHMTAAFIYIRPYVKISVPVSENTVLDGYCSLGWWLLFIVTITRKRIHRVWTKYKSLVLM
jgi:hypothetical protein